jgi:hypothetical protein
MAALSITRPNSGKASVLPQLTIAVFITRTPGGAGISIRRHQLRDTCIYDMQFL